MSLLLEALKKTGQNQQNSKNGTSPPSPAEQGQTASGRGSQADMEPARNSVRQLFAAKLVPACHRIRLGIIPMALLTCSTLALADGIYVWYATRPSVAAVLPLHALPPLVAIAPQAATPVPSPGMLPKPPPPREMAATQADSAPQQPQAAPAADASPIQDEAPVPRIHIESRPQTNSINPGLQAAYQAYRQGDLAVAEQQYNAVLQRDPRNRDALLGMAGIAQRQGQDGIASHYYEYVLALNPRDPEANAGLAMLSQDDTPDMESRLKLLLSQQPQSAALNFALGNLYAAQQRWPESQQAYFDAYSLQPDSADYAFNLAVSLDHLGQGKSAAQYYQRALQLDGSGSAGFDRKQVRQRLDALGIH